MKSTNAMQATKELALAWMKTFALHKMISIGSIVAGLFNYGDPTCHSLFTTPVHCTPPHSIRVILSCLVIVLCPVMLGWGGVLPPPPLFGSANEMHSVL